MGNRHSSLAMMQELEAEEVIKASASSSEAGAKQSYENPFAHLFSDWQVVPENDCLKSTLSLEDMRREICDIFERLIRNDDAEEMMHEEWCGFDPIQVSENQGASFGNVVTQSTVNFATCYTEEELQQEAKCLQVLNTAGYLDEKEYQERLSLLTRSLNYAKEHVQIGNNTLDWHTAQRETLKKGQRAGHRGGAKRSIRLFVSSTFADMKEERDHLVKKVLPVVQNECAKRMVHFSFVDLRWGITADQCERGEVINICLKEIDRCKPYFMCILGDRYGWSQSPERSDSLLSLTFQKGALHFPWISQYADRSITELEVRHAVLNNLQNATAERALFFMKDAETSTTSECESKHKRDRLDKLKTEIEENTLLESSNYSSVEDLGVQFFSGMMNIIDKDFPVGSAPTPSEREREHHRVVIAQLSRFHIGGEKYFRRINMHLDYEADIPLIITGQSGSGKSALLAKWISKFSSIEGGHFGGRAVIYHFVGATGQSCSLSGLLYNVIYQLQCSVSNLSYSTKRQSAHTGGTSGINNHDDCFASLQLPTGPRQQQKMFEDMLSKVSQKSGAIIILDGVDHLSESNNAHDLFWLPKRFPPDVSLIISGAEQSAPIQRLLERSSKTVILPIEPLRVEERLSFVTTYMQEYGKRLTAEQASSLAVAPQCAIPLFAKTLLEELKVFGEFERLNARIADCLRPKSIAELYGLVIQRLLDDYSTEVKDLLCLLEVSKGGLPESHLVQLLEVPYGVWSPMVLALSSLVSVQSSKYTLNNHHVRQAVKQLFFVPEVAAESGFRNRLIRFYLGAEAEDMMLLKGNTECEKQHASLSATLNAMGALERIQCCEEVPHQLTSLGRMGQLAYLMANETVADTMASSEIARLGMYKYWKQILNSEDISSVARNQLVSNVLRTTAKELRVAETQGKGCSENTEAVAAMALRVASFLTDLSLFTDAERLLKNLKQQATKNSGAQNKGHENILLGARTLAALNAHQGTLYLEMGQFFKASTALQQALHDYSLTRSGAKTSKVLEVKNTLAKVYRRQGKYEESLHLLEDVVAQLRKEFGEVHEEVATVYNTMGLTYQNKGDYPKAFSLLEKCASIRKSLFGCEHPDFGEALKDLADLYLANSNYSKAWELYQQAKKIFTDVYGNKHAYVAETISSMASVRQQQGLYREAELLYDSAVSKQEQLLGRDHPDIAGTLNEFGALFIRTKQYDKALECYDRVLRIRIAHLGEHHPHTALCLSHLGSLYQRLRQYSLAHQFFHKALRIYEIAYGGNPHMDIATTLSNMAGNYQMQSRLEQALPLYSKALDMLIGLVGHGHSYVAVVLSDLAVLFAMLEMWTEGEQAYGHAVRAYQRVFGRNHPGTAQVLMNQAKFYESQGKVEKSLDLYEQAYDILSGHGETEDEKILFLREKLRM